VRHRRLHPTGSRVCSENLISLLPTIGFRRSGTRLQN
jgi:hypothetical protein